MTDIETRLRNVTEADAYAEPWTFGVICREGADEITRLRAEVERLRAALDQIDCTPTDYAECVDGNMEKVREIARVALLAASQDQRLDMGAPIAPVQQPPESN
jgi:hypothetical protein